MDPAWEPEGPLVTSSPALSPTLSPSSPLTGRHISLVPLSLSHAPALCAIFSGAQNAHLFKYLPIGPYLTPETFNASFESLLSSPSDYIYAIISSENSFPEEKAKLEGKQVKDGGESGDKVLGILSLSSPSPQHRTIELGAIFSSLLSRTTGGTEAVYLLLKYCFDELGYMRVEWRCNDRNDASKRAALRLGFAKEGVLRRQQVVKGRSRDTAIFSVVADEWEVVRTSLERWLQEENFEGSMQRKKLGEIRAEVMRGG